MLPDLVQVRELGQANTRVTLMRNVTSGELVCRKSIPADAPNWDSQVRQMRNEFEVGRGNTHRALRRSLDFGIIRRRLRAVEACLLLEYVEGVPLDAFAVHASVGRLVKVFWHVADGLDELHRRGFVHADLKPQNILCAANGRPTLIDFGQSCPMLHTKQRVQGTADFIAPEQAKCQPLEVRTDVFCLGATMHMVFLGRPAQTHLNASSVRKGGRIVLERRTLQRNGEGELDAPLAILIEDCLQPDRADRPANMSLVKDRLELCYRRLSRAT